MNSTVERLAAAQRHYQAGQFQQAEQLCREVLAAEPHHPEASYQLGMLAMDARQFDAAAQLLRQAIEFGTPQASHYINLGLAYDGMGDAPRAVRALGQALALDENHPEGLNNLGAVLLRQDKFSAAAEKFRQALQQRPDFPLASENLRRVERERDRRRQHVQPEIDSLSERVRQNPQDTAARNRLGLLYIQTERPAEAVPHFQAIVEREPDSAGAWINWGNLLQLLERFDEAKAAQRRAVELDPRMEQVLHTQAARTAGRATTPRPLPPLLPDAQRLAIAGGEFLKQKRYADAERAYIQSLQTQAGRTDILNNLAAAQLQQGKLDEAIRQLNRALEIDPEATDALNNLGLIHLRRGDADAAIASFRRALEIEPEAHETAYHLGNAYRRAGVRSRALDSYLLAAALKPTFAEALAKAGLLLHETGRAAEADNLFRRALDLNPRSADVLNNWGNVQQDLNNFAKALDCYRRAVEVDPEFVPAHCSLGYLLNDEGKLDEARHHFQAAYKLQPEHLTRVLLSNALPTIYDSLDQLHACRARLLKNIQGLLDDDVHIDASRVVGPTMFYVAYQGYNDRDVQRDMGKVYQAPPLQPFERPRRAGRIRVGFVSHYFRDHTIGKLNLGLISQLSRERFEVVVISTSHDRDPLATQFRQNADRFVVMPYDLWQARPFVRSLDLDVLMFADVGMDPLTTTLAYSRMAPVQCVTWGHPLTTGSQSMDYFISSELLEVPEADEHYTERLVRLPDLAVCYDRPTLPAAPRSRESFGFAADRHLYGCPQSLFKMHPEFDEILAGILRTDERGELLLLEGKHPYWAQMLRERFGRTMPDVADRVHFLSRLPRHEFLSLNAAVDVLVDPIHFCGGNTSYEGLALGTPIVTLPSQFLRGRITAAQYAMLGYDECVVQSPADYVRQAVRLACEPDYRRAVSQEILARSDVLFGNRQGVRQLEDFFEQAVATWSDEG